MKDKTLLKIFTAMQQSRGFPALENTVSTILNKLHDNTKNISDLTESVISDFTMTQSVLRLANSVMYSPFNNNVSSVSDALKIIGNDALNHIALSVSLISAIDAKNNEALSETIMSAEIIYNVCLPNIIEDASIVSLLSNLGKLTVNKFLPEDMKDINKLISKDIDPDKAALHVLGLSLEELGIEIAKKWKLPPKIISNLDGTGDKDIINIVKFANKIAIMLNRDNFEGALKILNGNDIVGLDKTKLSTLIQNKQDGLIQEQTKVNLPTNNVHDIPDSEVILHELLSELSLGLKTSVVELSNKIFPVLSSVFKMSHCLLLMKNRTGDFVISLGYGKGIDGMRSTFKISSIFEPTVFHIAIKNNAFISIDDVSKLKVATLPYSYKTLFPNTKKFIILPISNPAVCGLIYCDWELPIKLSENELSLIKDLRDTFVPFCPH